MVKTINDKTRNPFTSREREFLISLSSWSKQRGLLGGFERKVLYEAGHYNFVFVARLSKINTALTELEDHLSGADAKYAEDIRNRGYQIFLDHTARQGSAVSQYFLGEAYLYGLYGLEMDDDIAVEWLSKAADQKYGDAVFQLAVCALNGYGVEEDEQLATKFFKKALKFESEGAAFRLAEIYLDDERSLYNPKLGLKYLRLSAKNGDPDGLVSLGDIYFDGDLVRESDKKALEYYQGAADQDTAVAFQRIGRMYELGCAVDQDEYKAVELYGIAAEAEDPDGILSLARCKFAGLGCEPDPHAAFEVFSELVDEGYGPPCFDLALCYYFGKGAPTDYGRAKYYFEKVSTIKPASHVYLGLLKSLGLGCDEDHEQAFEHFLEAIEYNEDERAKAGIGVALFYGDGVEQNYEEAVRWLLSAAEDENSRAIYFLGLCYADGLGVAQNKNQALQYFRSAAELGYEAAKEELRELGLTIPLERKSDGNIANLGKDLLAEARRVYRDISSDVTAKTDEDIRGKVIPFKTGAEIELVMKEYDR